MPNQPNLVYVFADQLRYRSCGFAGDLQARTSSIDRLASEGVSFCNAVSGHPLCAPYRASLFTGKYSSSTGMVINELRMNPSSECFAHTLHRAGYDTAYIGKWHLWANELGNHHESRNSFTPPGPYRLGFDATWKAYNFHHEYYDSYYHTDSPGRTTIGGYEPDGQTDLAVSFLRCAEQTGRPFALFLSYGTPHDPWTASNVPIEFYQMYGDEQFSVPLNYRTRNDPYADGWARLSRQEREQLGEWMRVYYAMTANLDENLARMLAAIDGAGLSDSTIVVFTSDHGEMFGAQGRRGKNIFYEEAIRVPFILRWPGSVPAGLVSDACLNTPDILPTLLTMMKLPVPDDVEGVDLSHCAAGKAGPEPATAFLQGMGCTAVWEDGHEWRAVRSKRHTYAIYRRGLRELLFDNQSDPYQTRNLVHDPNSAGTLRSLRRMLKDRMVELNDTFEACTWYRDKWTRNRCIMRSATMG